jgi:predicted permease
MSVDPGFDATNVLTLQSQAVGPRYGDSMSVYMNHARIIDAVRRLPGVEHVGTVSQLPLGGNVDMYGVNAQDKPLANPELAPYADRYAVSPDYMPAMGIAIRHGRAFTDADNSDAAPRVVIVSEGLASRIWPAENPIGKMVRMGDPNGPWRTVVGVAANVRHRALDATEASQIYIPERQWQFADNVVDVVVRTRSDPSGLARAVRSAVQNVDTTQPITGLSTMEQVITVSTAERRLALLLFVSFASLSLVLAVAGIYGVLAGAVTERTREIGVRIALGAARARVLALIIGDGMTVVAAGALAGVALAAAGSRLVAHLLYGSASADWLFYVAGAVSVLVVGFAASVMPARRAAAVQPLVALRHE